MIPSNDKLKSRSTPTCALAVCLSIWVTCALAGCSNILPETTPFGAVDSPDQFRSVNGLGVHRRMWEEAGAKCLTPRQLSPRMETMDVIVLVGQSFDPPGSEARKWLEDWLTAKSGRTVIYFGRDFNADVYYREKTLATLPEKERPYGEQRLAEVRANELTGRLESYQESTFCEWFYLDASAIPSRVTEFRGDWSAPLSEFEGEWPVRTTLLPPSRKFRSRKPSWLTTPKPVNPTVPLNPFNDSEDSVVRRSTWRNDELDTPTAWDDAFDRPFDTNLLLASQDGTPLIFSLTNRERIGRSKIIVVANGAPFLNASLVQPLHRKIGEKIIQECLPAKRVALLAYDKQGLLVSSVDAKNARGVGLEMLTEWPLSGITMPAALLGLIVCAALFPILGRPQELPPRSVSDFGLHVEALGEMLHESRDQEYALKTIAEYFKSVRGEAPPQWVTHPTGTNPDRSVTISSRSTASPQKLQEP